MRSDNPSALLLAIADEVRMAARAGVLRISEYVERLTQSELALIIVGSAARRVSPFSPVRDREIAALRATGVLREEVLPVLLASPAASCWSDELARTRQTWINLNGADPPGPGLFSDRLTRLPALATKPLGGLWTSTAMPGLASVWLTREPADWATLPSSATLWNVCPASRRLIRCYEIGGREDWVSLCEAFPEDSTQFYGQHLRTSLLQWRPPFLTPNWTAVREAFDAVHLQWSGFIDATNEVVPVLNGTTCLCGWGSESTLWLRWMFDEWSPIGTARPASQRGGACR